MVYCQSISKLKEKVITFSKLVMLFGNFDDLIIYVFVQFEVESRNGTKKQFLNCAHSSLIS